MTIKFNPLIILFFLTSCGGGSGSLDINQNDDPIINISSNLNEQLITKYVTLSWTSQNVDSCSASGGWTGIKPLNGSAEVQVNNIGVNNFSLNCSGYNGSISISISVSFPIFSKTLLGYLLEV